MLCLQEISEFHQCFPVSEIYFLIIVITKIISVVLLNFSKNLNRNLKGNLKNVKFTIVFASIFTVQFEERKKCKIKKTSLQT